MMNDRSIITQLIEGFRSIVSSSCFIRIALNKISIPNLNDEEGDK